MSHTNRQNSTLDIDDNLLREIVTASNAAASKNPQVKKAIWPEIAANYVHRKKLPFYTTSELKEIKKRLMNRWNHLK